MAGGWFSRADVAQLVEHSLGKGEVISSILIIGSMNWKTEQWKERFWEGRGFRREGLTDG